jgi:MFS family permease
MPSLKARINALTADLPATFWFLWLGTLVNRLGGFVVPFLTLYLTSQRGASPAQAAFIVSMAGAGSFLSQLVGGELTDRLGRRPVMLMSFFITPVAILTLGLVQAIWLIMLAVLLSGFFTDLYRPAVNASVADLVPADSRTRAFGYLYWAINLGAALAPVLAGLMAEYNYLLLFIGDAATTFIFGLIVLRRVPETQSAEAGQSARVGLTTRMSQLKREPILLVFTIMALFIGSIYMQNYVTLPLDMQANGLTPADYGLALAVNGGLIVLVTLQLSGIVGKWPRFSAMAASALLLGLGYGAVELAHTLPVYALTIAVWTMGEIIGATIAPTIITDLAPEELRGLYMGIFGSAWGLSFFIGPIAGGWVYEHLGPAALWRGCLLLGIVLALGYLVLGRRAKGRLESAA